VFDMVEELAAIHRGVARDDSGGTVTATVSRTYDADADDVWDALTNPERLPRWFYPVSGDLRAGGNFQLDGNAGGEIRECQPPSLLRLTWGSPDSVVDVRLSASGDDTTVEIAHTVPLEMARSGAGALFVGPGWDGALLGLAIHLRGQSVGDPLEAANSPEVIDFNGGSIERWTTAIESSGTATADEIAGIREIAVAQYTTAPS
jgi:uncharacterized protein YndB with AHSA1/START domain